MGDRPVYFDYAATTPVDPRVVACMVHYLDAHGSFGNPASRTHRYGWDAEAAVEQARAYVAELINADPREIIWTSGATESNNLALKGVAQHNLERGRHLVTTRIEHKSVLEPCEYLAEQGYEVTYLNVLSNGEVDLHQLEGSLRPDTVLVSIMHVNNEIGVIQNLSAMSQRVRERGILFHVDAAQSAGKVSLDVSKVPVDLMSLSAHKVYGPKGVGALYVRREVRHRLTPQLHGGGHEQGLRAGTVPPHQVVGMGEAFRLARLEWDQDQSRLEAWRARLVAGLTAIPGISINGSQTHRVPGIVSVRFPGVMSESLMSAMADVAVSAGSACSSGSIQPSHVLTALGHTHAEALSTLRFSLGRFTTDAEVDEVVRYVSVAVAKLRG